MVYIVFGVSGVGKTTVAKKLSETLSIPFYDADDFHSEHNISKMENGIPLNDTDRRPWLETLGENIKDWESNKGGVLACSALKESYRKLLKSIPEENLKWIFLDADINVITNRLKSRKGHYFKPKLLQTQFSILEIPSYGIHINANMDKTDVMNNILQSISSKPSFGLIGLGVMGESLALNIANKGISIAVYNRQVIHKEVDIAKKFKEDYIELPISGFDVLSQFVNSLEKPRNILLMVNAGRAVDSVISDLIPLLEKGDLIIDGGNSHYKNTKDRFQNLKGKGIEFIGMGISGGEEGALKGPSMMPGGSLEVYKRIAPVLEEMSAKDRNGKACCAYIGADGAGHFVKMIHNGIEYGEMQLIAEVYHLLRFHCNMCPFEIVDVFENWLSNGLNSYLLEISITILQKKEGGDYLIDKILDKASQKGTGGWSTNAALELGKPFNTIAESVMARYMSAMKSTRIKASSIYGSSHKKEITIDLNKLKAAYSSSRIVNHAIGFDTIKEASIQNDWNLDLSEISRIWTNGCIIRSELMEDLVSSFEDSKEHLLLHSSIVKKLKINVSDYSEIVGQGLSAGCTVSVLSSGLNYLLGFISEQSSANMIQAQRDYFGAHTYERVDKQKGEYFHTEWLSKK